MSNVSAQIYDMVLPANGSRELLVSGSYYRIRTNTGNVSIRRDGGSVLGPLTTGQGEQDVQFNRLTVTDLSGATNTVTVIVSDSHFVDAQLLGTVNIGNSPTVALSSADKLQLIRPEISTGFWTDNSALSANTALTIFTPASNVNGAIILTAEASEENTTGVSFGGFVAHTSAPANITTGENIASLLYAGIMTGARDVAAKLSSPVQIAAGKGLYYISNTAPSTNGLRVARYKLL